MNLKYRVSKNKVVGRIASNEYITKIKRLELKYRLYASIFGNSSIKHITSIDFARTIFEIQIIRAK